ncbi:MAG: 2TM domain-containing protein [Deltaproteobacteria bacterium]|nr:2TM domain-containing protein [Deltaproteobacteria bacterium]MBW2085859.1 2TM domain-containing protein [Deltaproteobacteria bacterium]
MENQETFQKAKKRVEARIGFYIHLAVYVGVNILLIIINLATSTQYLWFKWPLIGWGIGICFHALAIFVFPEGSPIKERMIKKEMEKEALKKQ